MQSIYFRSAFRPWSPSFNCLSRWWDSSINADSITYMSMTTDAWAWAYSTNVCLLQYAQSGLHIWNLLVNFQWWSYRESDFWKEFTTVPVAIMPRADCIILNSTSQCQWWSYREREFQEKPTTKICVHSVMQSCQERIAHFNSTGQCQ